jgi:hypothetical protein
MKQQDSWALPDTPVVEPAVLDPAKMSFDG